LGKGPLWGRGIFFNIARDFVIDGLEGHPLYRYRDGLPKASQIVIAHLNGFADEGEGSFFETTGNLGFRFEGDEGTHDGYVQLNGKRVRDFEVLSYAYESEPNTAIPTGAVPEPATTFFLMVLPALAWRRGRHCRDAQEYLLLGICFWRKGLEAAFGPMPLRIGLLKKKDWRT